MVKWKRKFQMLMPLLPLSTKYFLYFLWDFFGIGEELVLCCTFCSVFRINCDKPILETINLFKIYKMRFSNSTIRKHFSILVIFSHCYCCCYCRRTEGKKEKKKKKCEERKINSRISNLICFIFLYFLSFKLHIPSERQMKKSLLSAADLENVSLFHYIFFHHFHR